jgi:hypothetical protein
MKLLENLTDYKDNNLKIVDMGGRHYKTNQNFDPSVIVPQSFGLRFDEDSYNQIIAQGIKDSRIVFKKDCPAVIEAGFKPCLERIGEKNFFCFGEEYDESSKSFVFSPKRSDWVYKEAESLIQKLELDDQKILYLGHPAHMQRLISIAKKLEMNGFPFISEGVEWAKNDSQFWVKSPYLWISREILIRIHHAINGIA